MTGGPNEGEAVAKIVEQVGSDRCFNLAGRTTLRQLLVIYELAEVLVTNDSGPAHFAALTPIDVVTLFGPENPAAFCCPHGSQSCILGWHCLQPVRQCPKWTHLTLQGQRLHAAYRRGPRIRRSLPNIRGARQIGAANKLK